MSVDDSWDSNSANDFNGFTNQGSPSEQHEAIVWHPRGATTGATTSMAPNGGVTVVVNTRHMRHRHKPTLKTMGCMQMIFGMIYLLFGVLFLVFLSDQLYVGLLFASCLTTFIDGTLSIASLRNNNDPSNERCARWMSVLSIVVLVILLIVAIIGFAQDWGFDGCINIWYDQCMKNKQRNTVLKAFLMAFTGFATFCSFMLIGHRFKGCCSDPMDPVITVPRTQAAGSSTCTAFHSYTGQQESVPSAPPIQAAGPSMPTAFQGYAGQQTFLYNNPSANMNNTPADNPPSYDECVYKNYQGKSVKF